MHCALQGLEEGEHLVTQLRGQLERLDARRSSQDADSEDARVQMQAALESAAGAAQAQIQALSDQCEAAQSQIQVLTEQTQAAQSKVDLLAGQWKAEQSRVEVLTGQCNDGRDREQQLADECAQGRMQLDHLQAALDAADESSVQAQADAQLLAEQSELCQAELERAIGEASGLWREVEGLRQERGELERRGIQLGEEVAALQQQLHTQQQRLREAALPADDARTAEVVTLQERCRSLEVGDGCQRSFLGRGVRGADEDTRVLPFGHSR